MNWPREDKTPNSIWQKLGRWWRQRFDKAEGLAGYTTGQIHIRFIYGRFREILNLNDSLLGLFADVQEKMSGRSAFALGALVDRIRRGILDGFVLAKSLNQLTRGSFPELYDLLAKLEEKIGETEQDAAGTAGGQTVVFISGLRRGDAWLAGSKMAHLGEVCSLGMAVPDGFVATTNAFREFVKVNNLEQTVSEVDAVYESRGYEALESIARQVAGRIIEGRLPPDLESAMFQVYDRVAGGAPVNVAVRSSAVGEDTMLATHAGQYLSILNVPREGLINAYCRVVASAFTPQAVIYRYQHGLTHCEAAMAVGFMKMITARVSGVMFTRDFQYPALDRLRISVVHGIPDNLVSGRINAGEIVIGPDGVVPAEIDWFRASELHGLFTAGRLIEQHMESPQDIEWALDDSGRLFILQSRAMVHSPEKYHHTERAATGPVLVRGGRIACPGVGYGKVVKVDTEHRIREAPDGAVLVMRQATPYHAYLFPRCVAVLTEAGSPSSHLGILCREAGLPALMGLADVFHRLEEGQCVCVDASAQTVFSAESDVIPARYQPPSRLADSPAVRKLKKIGAWITPLHLTDPMSENFRADNCRTLHDLVRFVHEKLYSVMFGFGEKAARGFALSWKLQTDLPMAILVTDLGGGLTREPSKGELLRDNDISNVPFRVFLEGLLDKRIDWTKPRAVSGSGFMSVVGEGLTGPPAESQGLAQPSFVVLAHQYMSFSSRAGYHFSVIEAICSSLENKNFIHYTFGGGGAGEERRIRRAAFLRQVLTNLGFAVQVKGELVTARFLKTSESETRRLLTGLGRLTMCSRQLDMLMDSESSPGYYAAAFLDNQFGRF